ncbi:tRNA nucleotidyltransferase/poly(A) polymerase, RNA and SrmB- binding domain [Dillenia turbinata]|uniref:tRNA nucleotidyltransferase/poly(A) polymerase, RNA and SrmB- binding domain n=1 Tax=Dillenia turbinata TaxID=194707 RepID=A0AAN8ZEG2_9MAGN
MEMNYMLAFGTAEASLRLLWKFGLLEILFFPSRNGSDYISLAAIFSSKKLMLSDVSCLSFRQSLFCNLDRLVAPDRPCRGLAFHKALIDQLRDPYVIAAFSLAVHSGGSLHEAVDIAKGISQPHDMQFYELLQPQGLYSIDMVIDEIVNLAQSVKDALSKMTDEYFL